MSRSEGIKCMKDSKQQCLVIGRSGSGMSSIWRYLTPVEISDNVDACAPKQEYCNLKQKLKEGENS